MKPKNQTEAQQAHDEHMKRPIPDKAMDAIMADIRGDDDAGDVYEVQERQPRFDVE